MNRIARFMLVVLFSVSLFYAIRVLAQSSGTARPGASTFDAAQLELVGHLGGNARTISIQGNRAYLGIDTMLVVLDITDPAQPVPLGRTFFPATVLDIQVISDYVYVATGNADLWVVNVTNPGAPEEINSLAVPGGAVDMAPAGNYLYVSAGVAGLRVLNISEPAAPVEIGFWVPVSFTATSLASEGHFVYLLGQDDTGSSNNLRIVDISNPAAPSQVGAYHASGASQTDIAVVGAHAYLAWYAYPPYPSSLFGGLEVVDVSNPAAPAQVADYSFSPGNEAQSVAVSGNYALLGTGSGDMAALQVLNISNPSHPILWSSIGITGTIYQTWAAGNRLYVAAGNGGLQILDISNPATPQTMGAYSRETAFRDFWDVRAVRGRVYGVSKADFNLQIVDVATPSVPTRTGYFNLNLGSPFYGPRDLTLAVSDTHAYVGWTASGRFDTRTGFSLLDASVPPTVSVISTNYLALWWMGFPQSNCVWSQATSAFDSAAPRSATASSKFSVITTAGRYAYVGYGATLCIVDAGNPVTPTALGMYTATGVIQGIAIADHYAYLATASGGLRVLDVISPSQPVEVGFSAMPGVANDLAVAGNQAYVATDDGRLRIVDVSNPSLPVEIGSYSVGYSANAVVVTGTLAFVAAGDQGVRVVNIADPAAPYLMAAHQKSGTVEAIAAVGPYLYVASGSDGLYILKVTVWPGLNHQVFVPAAFRNYLPPARYYRFVARHSAKCLNVAGASLDNWAHIIQWDCIDTTNEQWRLVPVGNFVQIIARHSGKCLNVSGASPADGAQVIQWTCAGADNELWRLQPVGNAYELIARHSGKCLTIAGASLANWAQAVQSSCSGGENQLWQSQLMQPPQLTGGEEAP